MRHPRPVVTPQSHCDECVESQAKRTPVVAREPRSDSQLSGIQLATQPDMPGPISRQRLRQPLEYRDRHGRVWRASEVGQLKVVSPSIDGPNLCLVIRFEREGEELFARWLGDSMDWRGQQTLHRLFASADP
jgi:hypothetical protein